MHLLKRQLQCVPTTYVTENKEENYLEIHFPSIMSIVFTSFKYPKLPISIKIHVILLQIVYIFAWQLYLQIRVNELPLC